MGAPLEPSVEYYGDSKQLYKYKVVKNNYSCMFGFCHLNDAVKFDYKNNCEVGKGGYFLYSKEGTIYTHNNQKVSRK